MTPEELLRLNSDPTSLTTAALERAVGHLKELHSEKFNSISLQFKERDIRTQQASVASGEALAAALQAAKELVGAQGEASAAAAVKSETSFTKQIDQIGVIIESKDKATDARINELKERIDRGEGNSTGIKEIRVEDRHVRTEQRADNTLMIGLIVVGVTLLGIIVSIVALFLKG